VEDGGAVDVAAVDVVDAQDAVVHAGKKNDLDRVTKLGECLPDGRWFTLRSFLKITEVTRIWLTFSTLKLHNAII
jgi:hypothetical protein